MSPDSRSLAALASQWEDMNHLYVVENFLRRLLPEEVQARCSLSLALTDEGELSAAVAAIDSAESETCHRAASSLAGIINSPNKAVIDSALSPVVSKAEVVVATEAKVGKFMGGLNPINSAQNSLQDSVAGLNSKLSNTAAGAYNRGVEKMDQSADGLENKLRSAAGITASPTPLCCVAMLVVTAGLLFTMAD